MILFFNTIKTKLESVLVGEDDTISLGYIFGKILKPNDVVLLNGRLGVGKTVFSRGLARGIGINETYTITSPTFTLLNIYPGRIKLYHADLYRLKTKHLTELELLEEAFTGVLIVEWPNINSENWPTKTFIVTLTSKCQYTRKIHILAPTQRLNRLDK